MIDIRKRLESMGYEFADPDQPIDVSGAVITLPKRSGCDRPPPTEQPPFWEGSYAPGTCQVWALHPALLYPDPQDMPFDLTAEALKDARRRWPELMDGDQ